MSQFKGKTFSGTETETEIEIVDVLDDDDAVAHALVSLDDQDFLTAGFDVRKLRQALEEAESRFLDGLGYFNINENGVLVLTEYPKSTDGIVVMPMKNSNEGSD